MILVVTYFRYMMALDVRCDHVINWEGCKNVYYFSSFLY
jgi:hypothetical protein